MKDAAVSGDLIKPPHGPARPPRGSRALPLMLVGAGLAVAFGPPAVAKASTSPTRPYLPATFIAAAGEAPASGATKRDDAQRWWSTFQDPALDELVAAAVAANLNVRFAIARVDRARASVRAATANLLPSINAVGATSLNTTGYDAIARQQLPDLHANRGALQVSWELDLFGRVRASRRAAQFDAVAADAARRGAILLAVGETAREYFALRGAQDQRQIVAELVDTQRETLRLTELRRRRGTASDFDLDRARAELAASESALPRLETRVVLALRALDVLTGRSPGAWDARLAELADRSAVPPAIPADQPAALLRRRPDLLAAEATLAAAGHRQEAARSLRFPQFFVSALFGSQWTDVNGMDIGRARFTNVAAALAMPVMAGGGIRAGIAAADAATREAEAHYEQAVLRALADVESALTAFEGDTRRAALLQRSVDARASALRRARSLYRAGEIDLLQLLEVQRGSLASRLEESANRTARLTDAVQTYQALGGGWEPFETASAGAAAR